MGQVCSGRRVKPTTSRPPSQPAPPPYSAPKSPTSVTSQEKDPEPELSSHPALRNRGNSLSDPASPVQKPLPAHLHTKDQQNGNEEEKENWDEIANITVESTPQWRWSNTQCRFWLTQVLIVYGGRPSPVAHRLAHSFRGWGPNLYMKEWKEWNAWLRADGQAIFALLMEEHGKEGAVPKEVEIEHYVRAEAEGSEYRMLEIGLRGKYPLKKSTGSAEEKEKGMRGAGAGAGMGTRTLEIENFVGRGVVEDVRRQVASEWGKGRLKKLTEEREKLREEEEAC